MKKDVNMLSGSIIKGLITIAMPIMVMNVLQSLFNIIDMTILKMYDTDGGYTVGAVGAGGTLISLITGLLIGSASGANVIIAKYIGKGDDLKTTRSVGAALFIAIAGGLILLVVGVCFAEVFLGLVNCPPELMSQASLYFRLYFVGVPILMIYNFCAAILRSTGDTRRPMVFLTIGGVFKVILTFVFVAFFNMKVEGVAFATIISWLISAGLAFSALYKNEGKVKTKFSNIKFFKLEIKQILKIGIPAGLQQALYSVANVIIAATVNSFGKDATTGISIANQFDGILYQIVTAPALAVMPYVSQNVGNGNIKRATQSIIRGIMITVCLGATFGSLSAIFSTQLSSIMSSNPAVLEYSKQKMIIVSSTYFICGINEIIGSALRGMGRPLVATIATLLFMCAIRFVWVYLVFPLVPNLTFLYLIWPIGWILSISMLTCFIIPTIKRLRKENA